MIIDALLQFSDKQDIKAGGASTEVIDLKQPNPDIGLWEKALNAVVVPTTPLAGEDVTLKVELQDCDTKEGTFATVLTSGEIDAASFVATAPLILPMPKKHRRFLKLKYTVAGTATAGSVSAYLTDAVQANTNWMPEKI